MAEEIERKFLVTVDSWKTNTAKEYRQGYLCTDKERTVRVRIAGDKAFLTVKGVTKNFSRSEYEYSIPTEDAEHMLNELCLSPLIEKRRHKVNYTGMVWEVDEFFGDNEGLIIAEIELNHPDQEFEKPPWLGREVSNDPRYYNANLVASPFKTWADHSK